MNPMTLKPIGIVHSPFKVAAGTPVQSKMAKEVEGMVEVLPEFLPALRDLEGFDRIWLLFWFDRAVCDRLVVKPYLDDCEHGVFATRSPCRPNPIGLSCVRLLAIDENRLRISGMDILDHTPVLDIKPYVPYFDCFEAQRVGWLQKDIRSILADDRFEDPAKSSRRID